MKCFAMILIPRNPNFSG